MLGQLATRPKHQPVFWVWFQNHQVGDPLFGGQYCPWDVRAFFSQVGPRLSQWWMGDGSGNDSVGRACNNGCRLSVPQSSEHRRCLMRVWWTLARVLDELDVPVIRG
jgi:hypothetical protein